MLFRSTRIVGTLEAGVANHRKKERDLFLANKQEALVLIRTLQVHDSTLESANLNRLQDSIQLYKHRLKLAEGTEEEPARQEKLDRLEAELDEVIEGRRPYKEHTEESLDEYKDIWFRETGTVLEGEGDETTRIQQPLTTEATTLETPAPTTRVSAFRALFTSRSSKQRSEEHTSELQSRP